MKLTIINYRCDHSIHNYKSVGLSLSAIQPCNELAFLSLPVRIVWAQVMLKNQSTSIQEIELLKNLKHQHIITPIEYCIDDQYIYLVTDFCRGGSLYEKIINSVNYSEN